MNCYYHPNQPAVGLCKHCQRGLCIACAADVDDSLACKDRHEEQVHALDALTKRNLLQAGRLGSVYRRNAISISWSVRYLQDSVSCKSAGWAGRGYSC